MPVCKRVLYSGTVQGVGFRMTARRIAGQFAVRGYVRNLADGQVEVVVAGESREVENFLEAVAAHMASYIQGCRIEGAAEQTFTEFDIRI